ncbi:MAG: hypothetical protein R6X19_03330 [Kiritimatiellia bacterium]
MEPVADGGANHGKTLAEPLLYTSFFYPRKRIMFLGGMGAPRGWHQGCRTGRSERACAGPVRIQTPIMPPGSTPAPEAKAPVVEGAYISFACAVCSSSLKVSKSFTGKTIQCPKCVKKTLVPGGAPKDFPASQASVAISISAPADDSLLKSLGEQERKMETVMRPMEALGGDRGTSHDN